MPGYSDAFKSSLPPTMSHYVKPENMNFELTDLLKECERVFTSYLVNTYKKPQNSNQNPGCGSTIEQEDLQHQNKASNMF